MNNDDAAFLEAYTNSFGVNLNDEQKLEKWLTQGWGEDYDIAMRDAYNLWQDARDYFKGKNHEQR
jgi:hypothetical protein